jgi:hypothetical protein
VGERGGRERGLGIRKLKGCGVETGGLLVGFGALGKGIGSSPLKSGCENTRRFIDRRRFDFIFLIGYFDVGEHAGPEKLKLSS